MFFISEIYEGKRRFLAGWEKDQYAAIWTVWADDQKDAIGFPNQNRADDTMTAFSVVGIVGKIEEAE